MVAGLFLFHKSLKYICLYKKQREVEIVFNLLLFSLSKSYNDNQYRKTIKGEIMENKILRKLYLAFMRIHILHHAKEEPFFGLWMIEELKSHGYEISSGTLYPILHSMEEDGILKSEEKTVDGKVRKYYSLTEAGNKVLKEVKEKTKELTSEVLN